MLEKNHAEYSIDKNIGQRRKTGRYRASRTHFIRVLKGEGER
jgi:hypothetical protein